MKWISFAWRNVMRNKRRTLLTAGVICVGTAAMLIAVGFILATFWGLRELTVRSEVGHLQIGVRHHFDKAEEKVMQLGMSPAQAARAGSVVARQAQVRFSMQRIAFEGLLSNGEKTVAVVGSGVEPAKEAKLSSVLAPILKGGGLPEYKGEDQFQIMLAVDLANNLGARPGQSVTLLATTEDGVLNAIDVKVAGIYSTGVPEQDKRSIMVPLETAQTLLRTEKISRLVVVLDRTEHTDAVAATLQRDLADFDVRTWSDLAFFYHRVVRLYSNVFSVMAAILLTVILLSSINSMLMNVMERVREIGTLRAFGITARQISRNFLLEGTQLGISGALAGIILGLVVSVLINLAQIPMPPPPGRNISYPLTIMMQWDYYALIFALMSALSGVGAWLAGRKVARMKIVEALGHV